VRIVAKRCELNYPAKSFSPRLQAFLVAQLAEGFISSKKLRDLASYFGIKVPLGPTYNILKRSADLLKN